jgi:hypothetical protein
VRLEKLEYKLRELGCDGDGECVGGSRDGEGKVAVGRGRATYGERAACCDPAAPGGPVLAASCWINAAMEGRARRRVVGRLSEESVILRKRARPDCQSSGRASRPVDLALLDTPAPSL